jgi:hypothetical protein
MDENNTYNFAYTYNTPPNPLATRVRFTVTAYESYLNYGMQDVVYGIYDTTTQPSIEMNTTFTDLVIQIGDSPVIAANIFSTNGIASVQTLLTAPTRSSWEEMVWVTGSPTYYSHVQQLPEIEVAGTYTLVLVVTDANGLSANAATTFVVEGDTEAPAITIITPSPNQEYYVGLAPVLTATITDNFGVVYVATSMIDPSGEVVFNGDVEYDSLVNATLEVILPTIKVAGLHIITVKAYDEAGNEGIEVVEIMGLSDTTPPVITIYTPTDGQLIYRNDVVTVYATVTDNVEVESVELKVVGPLSSFDPYYFTGDVNQVLGNLIPGQYTAVIIAIDTNGNRAEEARIFEVLEGERDIEPPTITFYTPTGERDYYENEVVNVLATVTDNEEVASVLMTIDGPEGQLLGVENYWNAETNQVSLPLANLIPGNYHILIQAWDTANNTAEASRHFVVKSGYADLEAPTVTINTPYEGNEFYIGNRVTINANITDNVGVVGATIVVNGTNSEQPILTVEREWDPAPAQLSQL